MTKYIYLLIITLLFASCATEFLDAKPDKSLVVPQTPDDMWAILDNTTKMNIYYPSVGEIGADNYYIESVAWNTLTDFTSKNAYVWSRDLFNESETSDWSNCYVIVFTANVVLEGIDKYRQNFTQEAYDEIKSTALFFRAYAFHELSQLFMQQYDNETAGQTLGIPLRLDPDLNKKTTRSTARETYNQILEDITAAVQLLPIETMVKTRPNKAAGYGLLARIYLSMGAYIEAEKATENCLAVTKAKLMDYNDLDKTANNPFKRFNDEVIFHNLILGKTILAAPRCKVDSLLYKDYHESDLRRSMYFQESTGKSWTFKGSYDGSNSLFGGIALDEIYLIRAECLARTGDNVRAKEVLNELLKHRFIKGDFESVNSESDFLLQEILENRRKELAFRGLRWSDLRRLNTDSRFETTLKRVVDGKVYELAPNDTRYVLPIPNVVISLTGIEQNP